MSEGACHAGPVGQPGLFQRSFKLRVAILLAALLAVAAWALLVRHRETRPVDWTAPHRVVVCPLLAPGTDASTLREAFAQAPDRLEAWAAAQHEWWTGEGSSPLDFELLDPLAVLEPPPMLPQDDASFWRRLRGTSRFLRYLENQAARFPPQEPDDSRIWLYVHRGIDRGAWEDRFSVGTRRGRLGVVFASDDPEAWGNTLCVLMHETLHTVGAKDHREANGTIAFPSGYADPSAEPRVPQAKAEIMALGIPQEDGGELRVEGLADTSLGLWTAKEIGWR